MQLRVAPRINTESKTGLMIKIGGVLCEVELMMMKDRSVTIFEFPSVLCCARAQLVVYGSTLILVDGFVKLMLPPPISKKKEGFLNVIFLCKGTGVVVLSNPDEAVFGDLLASSLSKL